MRGSHPVISVFRSLRDSAGRVFFGPTRESASPRPGSCRGKAGNPRREPVPAALGFPGLQGPGSDREARGRLACQRPPCSSAGRCGVGDKIGPPAPVHPPPPAASVIRGIERLLRFRSGRGLEPHRGTSSFRIWNRSKGGGGK